MKWQVSLNNSSFDQAGITKDCQDAVCEYIWNGFEAGASIVRVNIEGSPLQESMSLVVTDNGSGIPFYNFGDTFGTFLSSKKNELSIRIKSHANKGKGRFSYLSFSSSARWDTIYKDNNQIKKYTIYTDNIDKCHFETTEPILCNSNDDTGTRVYFPLFDEAVDQLNYMSMKNKLLEEFAWFLHLNKSKNFILEYMGVTLDPSQYINSDLSNTFIEKIDNSHFNIDVIVWKNNVSNSSKIYFLTAEGEIINVENTSFNKNKARFYHAVFVSSSYFKPGMLFSSDNDITLFDKDLPDNHKKNLRILRAIIYHKLQEVLKNYLISQADIKLSEMETNGTFPDFSNDEYGQLRKRDFQNVTKELYCIEPQIFHKLNKTQESSLLGFLNLLLSSDERENVLKIVEQIVSLTPEQRKTFAEVLKRSKLQYIIDAISIIERRVSIIEELKRIVFTAEKFANERDHIQKIIEQHFWLFGEQYHLLTADKNLSTSLTEYETITACKNEDSSLSIPDIEARQRIDIFLYTQRLQENNVSEMLIIELKAPHIKLSLEVFNQIVRYANTIRKEPRFASHNRIWKFFTICSEIDDDVKIKYNNFKHHQKNGLADIIDNFELYALTWDDVFQSFESRHNFMLDKLKLDYSQVATELGVNKISFNSKADVSDSTRNILTKNAF